MKPLRLTDLPVTLHPTRRQSLISLLGSIAFVITGLTLLHYGNAWGYLCLAIFIPGTIASLLFMLPSICYLRLTRRGITLSSIFNKTTFLWSEIEKIGIYPVKGYQGDTTDFVTLLLTEKGTQKHSTNKYARKLKNFDTLIPDIYYNSPTQFHHILTTLHLDYLEDHAQNTSTTSTK